MDAVCAKCGWSDWSTRSNGRVYCKECNRRRARWHRQRGDYQEYMREYLKEWHERNPEKQSEYQRAWIECDPERYRETVKRENASPLARARKAKYRQSERGAQKRAEWYERNREALRDKARAHYEANCERYKARVRDQRRLYPERKKAYDQKRRALKAGSEAAFTGNEWLELCERHDFKCLACGTTDDLSVDHVVPLSRGGGNGIENIQPLCARCNARKATRIVDYRRESA